MVIATQNPIEQAGTYRLPEAQLDRFLMKTSRRLPRPRRPPCGCSATPRSATGARRSSRSSPPASSATWRRSPTRCYVDPAILGYVAASGRGVPAAAVTSGSGLSVARLPGLRALRQDLGASPGPRPRGARRHQDARRAGALPPAARSTPRPSSPGSRSSRSSTRSSATSPPPVQGSAAGSRFGPGRRYAGRRRYASNRRIRRAAEAARPRRSCSGRRRATTRRPSAPCTGPRTPPGWTPHASTRIPRAPVRPRVADRSS